VNWARLVMVIAALLAAWLAYTYWSYRRLVRQFDEERERAMQWTEDRL
jgi:hypothetical protein